jgi:SAM-dependent methyltransferase
MKSAQFELHADIEERHWWFRGRRRIMRAMIRRMFPPSRDTTILDIGCGTGGNIGALGQEFSCVGIDSSAEAIEFARRRFPGVRFLCGSVSTDCDGVWDQANLLLLMDVLEHVPDDFRLLSEILSLAKPGTVLLITVPAGMELWSKHDESFGHYRRYDAHRLALLWKDLPVTPLLVSYFNARLYMPIRLIRTVTRLRGRPFGRAGTDFRIPNGFINVFLENFFARETHRLEEAFDGKSANGFPRGASLIALLRREPGALTPRSKPPGLPPDAQVSGAPHGS